MNEGSKFNNISQKPLILLSPLDWGLGHTTRCIPLIRELHTLGWQVAVACNSDQKAVLEAECPQITFLFLKGYDVFYGTNRATTYLTLLFQLPKILIRIKKERKWLKKIAQQATIKATISDNRYGFYLPNTPSIFITHQLLVKTGAGMPWDRWLQRLHYRMIRKFSACWVPDQQGRLNAAGELSHPLAKPPLPLAYIGCLSRLQPCTDASPHQYHLLVMLSGPEPQRTLFEKLVVDQLTDCKHRIALVRGIPAGGQALSLPAHVTVFDRLSSQTLNELICASRLVLCRSGYSSIMDLLKLRKRMILVPTPGQTEQEYLARWLHQNGLACIAYQQSFSLPDALQKAESFSWRETEWDMEQYRHVLAAFTNKIRGENFIDNAV